ncbi:MAG: tetratricopeptide repeat protein [Elusimicrobia bacterium]|nr:tetratricopeptide repeat protein [Elusimicrobiota bacterium]
MSIPSCLLLLAALPLGSQARNTFDDRENRSTTRLSEFALDADRSSRLAAKLQLKKLEDQYAETKDPALLERIEKQRRVIASMTSDGEAAAATAEDGAWFSALWAGKLKGKPEPNAASEPVTPQGPAAPPDSVAPQDIAETVGPQAAAANPLALPAAFTPPQAELVTQAVTPPAGVDSFDPFVNNPNLSDPATQSGLDQLASDFPRDPGVAGLAGAANFRKGDFAKAVGQLDTAIEGDPQKPSLFYLRGAANLNLGRKPEASADLAKAVSLDPGNSKAKDLLMLAEPRVLPASFRLPPPSAAPRGRPVVGVREEPPGAPPAAVEAPSVPILMRSAREQQRVGDGPRAVDTLRKAVAAAPAEPAPRLMLTEALLRDGRFREAEGEATRLLEFTPSHVGALNLRATARNRQGDFQGALRDSEAALSLMPGSALGRWARAYALAGLKRTAEALAEAGQAAALDARFAPVMDKLRDLAPDADPLVAFSAGEHPEAVPAGGSGSAGLRVGLAAAGAALALVGLGVAAWNRRRGDEPAAGLGTVMAGNYLIETALGGAVYKARDLTLKRAVAVKLLRGRGRVDPEAASRLLAETAGSEHPSLGRVHTAVSDGDDLLLVFEYLDGRD